MQNTPYRDGASLERGRDDGRSLTQKEDVNGRYGMAEGVLTLKFQIAQSETESQQAPRGWACWRRIRDHEI